jgi:hypothetical protein
MRNGSIQRLCWSMARSTRGVERLQPRMLIIKSGSLEKYRSSVSVLWFDAGELMIEQLSVI